MQTCWTVGYVIGEIPSNIILTRIRPSIWIPAMEVGFAYATKDIVLTIAAHLGGLDVLPLSRQQCRNPVCASVLDW